MMTTHRRIVLACAQAQRLRSISPGEMTEAAVVLTASDTHADVLKTIDSLAHIAKQPQVGITIITAAPAIQAEAVVRGLRASTSLRDWEAWLDDSEARHYRRERRRRLTESSAWHVLSADAGWPGSNPLTFAAPGETLPTFISDLRQQMGMPTRAEVALSAEERYADAIIDMIYATGGYAILEYQVQLG